MIEISKNIIVKPKVIAITVSALMLSGCIGGSGNTIGSLGSKSSKATDLDFKNVQHKDVRKEYQEILDLVEDKELKEKIQRRIAGVYVHEGDKALATGKTRKGYYQQAIANYVDILQKYPNSPDNAEVLYQLAKSYDMEGQSRDALNMLVRLTKQHPTYKNLPEAYFRMGDIYFNDGNYVRAALAYEKVVEYKHPTLLLNAQYMLAWAQYKLAMYEKSLAGYGQVLKTIYSHSTNGNLRKTDRSLHKDALHATSLALVNLGGPSHIESIKGIGGESYTDTIYKKLAEYYLNKDRYGDSASTYETYVKNYPDASNAPEYFTLGIAAYKKGGFALEVLQGKEAYVKEYGLRSNRWNDYQGKVQANVTKNINSYLNELSGHYHGLAQKQLKKSKQQANVKLAKQSKQSFAKAIAYYQEFIDSFPKSKLVTDKTYLMAEAYFQDRQFLNSAEQYTKVAYQLKSKKHGVKAGYAAIVSYNNFEKAENGLGKLNQEEQAKVRSDSIDALLNFANAYPTDKRSPDLLTRAAEQFFKINDYKRSIEVANGLLAKKVLSKNLRRTALGILGHSHFNLKEYPLAESAYLKQIKFIEQKDPEHKMVRERIAMSIYQQGRALIATGKDQQAIKKLLSIKPWARTGETRLYAQYDAVGLMLKGKQWKPAIKELLELDKKFAKSEFGAEFPRKLAFAYQEDKQLKKAVSAYMRLYKTDKDKNVKREALFLAAGLEVKLNNKKAAIKKYRDYAHEFEQPFDPRMEARYQLAKLYKEEKDMSRHLFWLRRIIDGDKKAGDDRTDRSVWLAAWANTEYGDYFAWEFNKRKLRLPLENSIPKKSKFLQDAATRYEMAAGYGVQEFTTKTTFKTAELYYKFSKELELAPRPKGLSKADSALYDQILGQQAAPLKDLAAQVHTSNLEKAWAGQYNEWIQKSFEAMAEIQPERFGKEEVFARYGDEIR